MRDGEWRVGIGVLVLGYTSELGGWEVIVLLMEIANANGGIMQ